MKNKKHKTSFWKQRKGALYASLFLIVMFLIASLYVVLRVQIREQKHAVRIQAIGIINGLVNGQGVKKSGIDKFFLLRTMSKFNKKLLRFKFIAGYDKDNPDKKFHNELHGAKFQRLHDIAAKAVVNNGEAIEYLKADSERPVLVMALVQDNNRVAVIVRPVDVNPPAIPWGMLIILVVTALLMWILIPPSFYPLAVSILFAVFAGLLVSGYRLDSAHGVMGALKNGFSGLTRGYFPLGWGVFSLLTILFGWFFKTGRVSRIFKTIRTHRIAYTYVLPAMGGMLILVLLPFLIGLGLGFMNHCNGSFRFVGLRNFWEILSGGGASITNPLNFYFTLGVTLMWTFLNVFLHVSIGLGIALLLKDPLLKMKGIYRVLLIIPWAMPNYITALMWKGMFQQQYGAINILLDHLGIGGISWFSSFWPAFMANVITNTWLGFPFMMVVSLGALQSIPSSLYEAAEVDGASKWQQFKNITLPLLRPALFPSIILGSIWTFNMFNVIYLVSGGEPGGATDILITEAYQWAFKRGERYGLAAAYAILIFIVLIIYSRMANKLSNASEDM